MTATEIAALRQLCAEASAPPWQWDNDRANRTHSDSRVVALGPMTHVTFEDPRTEERDAEFICTARTALPAALDELERLRGLLKRVEWRGSGPVLRGYCCPLCHRDSGRGHGPDCELAAALA